MNTKTQIALYATLAVLLFFMWNMTSDSPPTLEKHVVIAISAFLSATVFWICSIRPPFARLHSKLRNYKYPIIIGSIVAINICVAWILRGLFPSGVYREQVGNLMLMIAIAAVVSGSNNKDETEQGAAANP